MTKRDTWTTLLVIAALLVGALALAACGGDDDDNGDNGDEDAAGADLVISAIEMDPTQPDAGEPFRLEVLAKNEGDETSDGFEVVIVLRDVSRGADQPVGTFTHEGLEPGEEVSVYATEQRRVTQAGSYQVRAQLTPSGEDANTLNNSKMRAFTAED
jgi:subtilase family serine protease